MPAHVGLKAQKAARLWRAFGRQLRVHGGSDSFVGSLDNLKIIGDIITDVSNNSISRSCRRIAAEFKSAIDFKR